MRHRYSAGRDRLTRRDAIIRTRMRSRREEAPPPGSGLRQPIGRQEPYVSPPGHIEPTPHIEPSLPPPAPDTVPRPDAPVRVQPPPSVPGTAPGTIPGTGPGTIPGPGVVPGPGPVPGTIPGPGIGPEPGPGSHPSADGAQQPQPDDASKALDRYGALQLPVPGKGNNIHCLTIIGQIEGHLVLPPQNKTTKYEHTIPQLVAIELNPAIEGLLVILNTVGGDVEAGLAIAEMVASLSKPKVSLVVGGGHSIGVPIAVAADRSFITHTATMTIHPIRLSGLVVGVPQTYEYLDKMQDRVVKFIVTNSHISEACFRELMFRTGELARDIGTVLVGHDAVRIGLVDAVGGLEEAITELKGLIEERRRANAGKSQDAARQEHASAETGERSCPRYDEAGAGPPTYHAGGRQSSEALECPWRPGDV